MSSPRQNQGLSNSNLVIAIITTASAVAVILFVCVFVIVRRNKRMCQRNETPIQQVVTPRIIYNENEQTTRSLPQASTLSVPTATPTVPFTNSSHLTQPSHFTQPSHSTQPSHFTQPSNSTQPSYMYNRYNDNNDVTNNSVLTVDAPPSYNNVHAFNSPQTNTAQLPSYSEVLVEQNTQ